MGPYAEVAGSISRGERFSWPSGQRRDGLVTDKSLDPTHENHTNQLR
jgi:hypothetical protein